MRKTLLQVPWSLEKLKLTPKKLSNKSENNHIGIPTQND
jgi:hypothetical protein